MIEVFLETLFESLTIIPFLYVTYLLIHFLLNMHLHKSVNIIQKAGRFGPLFSSLLGLAPQCGFSAVATELFANRIITIGTLVALYLSTSDEMLVILISKQIPILKIILILTLKLLIGILVGFACDLLLFRKRNNLTSHKTHREHIECECHHHNDEETHNHDIEDCKHCTCCTITTKNGKTLHPLIASLIHSLRIFMYVFVVSFIVHILIHYIGKSTIETILTAIPFLDCVLTAIVGLIPNCAISVIITELWIDGIISFGSMMSGLLVCSGVGVILLFHNNKNMKENTTIISILVLTGIISGILIDFISKIVI